MKSRHTLFAVLILALAFSAAGCGKKETSENAPAPEAAAAATPIDMATVGSVAGYLLYLAFKTIRSSGSLVLAPTESLPAGALFRRGFIMNVLNPKVALFFLAFLPQFVNPLSGGLPLQMILLGAVFMLQAVVIFSLIGWFSGTIGRQLLARPHIAKYFDRLTAGVFAALGLKLALSERG